MSGAGESSVEKRPDGRTATPQTLRLRTATRALRLHLDELPIDYDLAVFDRGAQLGLGGRQSGQRQPKLAFRGAGRAVLAELALGH